MELGAFSISLNVKDIQALQTFYGKLGFEAASGDAEQGWLIVRNNACTIGLFKGMIEKNTLTFNPGWDQQANPIGSFQDIRAPLRILDLTEDDWLNGLWPSAAMLAPGFPGVSRAPIELFPLQDRAQAISYSEYCHTAAAGRFSWTRRRML